MKFALIAALALAASPAAFAKAKRHCVGAYVAACARTIVHDHLLAPALSQAHGHRARKDVGVAACAERHHDADRFHRI